MIYDLIIIGGGPAGCAAAVYAGRKKLKTLLVLKEWGGQSIVSEDIQNWIGMPHISGVKLAESLKSHVLEYKGDHLDVKENFYVTNIEGEEGNFSITLENGEKINSKTVLIATGSSHRKLEVENTDKFEHKGITYCASCDGPMFTDQDVVVIGGGNAGFESASQLLAYCSSVTLLSRSEPRADKITIDKLLSNSKFKLIKNVTPKKVDGDKFVSSFTYTDSITNEDKTISCSGIFVEIGQIPATDFAKNIVNVNEVGNIIVDPKTQETTKKGVWAAGDCTDVLYHQNNIAVGDALKALEDIYLYLNTK